jgi:hypothetical protein
MRRPFVLLGLACIALVQPAHADDADALSLADSARIEAPAASDWQVFSEAAFGQSTPRAGGAATANERLSLDLQFDKSLAPHWRALLADRLDVNWPAQGADQRAIHTLKEAYLSWQAQDDALLDLGRINARYGVAAGYNPTDFFRAGAIRSVVSVDPTSLKTNRQGSVMLRGQTLWNGGSLTALASPKLADQPSAVGFNPDWGGTNGQNRWLLAASQKLTQEINPQWLVSGGEGQSPQYGFNLTTLLGDASVAFVEWSGGRSRPQLSQALNLQSAQSFRNRVATGATYTSENKLSLTLEYDYDGAALNQMQWNALMRGAPQVYGAYRNQVQNLQDLPTQQSIFLYANWQDALLNHLDLRAMARIDVADRSRLSWLEARYHWTRSELALQWQVNSGATTSDYGAAAQRRAWQVLLREYL